MIAPAAIRLRRRVRHVGLQLALGRLRTQTDDCNYRIRLLPSAKAAEILFG
jgi:hypothetical protein